MCDCFEKLRGSYLNMYPNDNGFEMKICFEGSESRGFLNEIDNQQVNKNEY